MSKYLLSPALLSAILMVGCSTDAAYDRLLESDGIDLSIKIADGLTLPFGSTDKIMLTELMDTAKVKQLFASPEGQFFLSEQGTIEPSAFGVTAPKFNLKPTLNSNTFTLDAIGLPQEVQDILSLLDSQGLLDGYLNHSLGEIPGISGEIQTQVQCSNLSFDKGSDFNIHITDVTDGLRELSSVKLLQDVLLQLDINISGLPGLNQTYGLTLDQLTLQLPEFVKVSLPDGTPVADPTHISIGSLTATKAAGNSSAKLSLMLNISGLDFGASPVQNQNGVMDHIGTAAVAGVLSSATLGINANDLIVTKDANGIFKVQFANSITLSPEFADMELELHEVTGKFAPSISSSSTSVNIDLNDDMDFLRGNDVAIDLKDPAISIDINNPCPVRIFADFTLNASNGREVKFNQVDLSAPSGSKTIVLDKDNVAEGYNFSTFLSPVPQTVSVNIQPYADQLNTYTFTLGEEQEVSGSYSVNVPLSFNSINFTYDKRVTDIWGENREDITDRLSSIGAELHLTLENAIPMDLELSVVGTSVRTHTEDPSLVSCQFETIKAGSLSKPSESQMQAVFKINNARDLEDLIIRFNGSGANCDFNANQYIRIKSASIHLNEGITVDLN